MDRKNMESLSKEEMESVKGGAWVIIDGEWYWVDTYLYQPVYADRMYVMISNVTSYGNDPDTDCCITEFHPFQY